MRAVTGHHGTPPKIAQYADQANSHFLRGDRRAAAEFIDAMAALLLNEEARRIPDNLGPKAFSEASEILSWWFAGVTVLADWLGSNTDFFPYRAQAEDLRRYREQAQDKARKALGKSGVLPVPVADGQTLHDFFPFISEPSPLQDWACRIPLPAGAQIHLLEDITGAGKTEAAIVLAYRLMAQGLADGFFIGLPTMASANAMYRRLTLVYQKLFAGNASLVLAHGHKELVEEFAKSVLPPDAPEHDSAQLDQTASARCTAWLADHSKRALLSAAGVGTIDQALLAVLHSKHQSIRLVGLFNKVLIIDEVHACDAYMQGVLETLLEFHARTNGAAILLSATMPKKMKQALLDAYARGRNQPAILQAASGAYPLATSWHDGQTAPTEHPLASRANVSRRVQVHYESEQEAVFAHILASLRQGQCVGWIRNTVADAMAAFARLSKDVAADDIILFHARFALCDRLCKEEDVLASFGPQSGQRQRRGRLMIATQVVEQSLDVDFDVLITDLAPIDRILQRAGRLQRHVRDADGNRPPGADAQDGRPAPCLWVYAPPWTEQPGAHWIASVFPKGQYVYPDHGQCWLTAKALQQGAFTMPLDARRLIESVFAGDQPVPPALDPSVLKANGKGYADASTAQRNTVKIVGGYARGDLGDWWEEAKTPSRLGEETSEIMLAKWVDGQLQQWKTGAWPYSMVKMAARRIAMIDAPSDPAQKEAYARLQASLPAQGKWCLLLPLTRRADGVWQGRAWTAKNETANTEAELLTWLYDADFGLRVAGSDIFPLPRRMSNGY